MSLHELKPCPFCGGQTDKHIDDYGEGKFYVTVRCSKCGAKVCHKGAIETATQEAVNTWNRRADEGKSEFSDAGWERLLLLFLLSFLEPPQKREISINAQINGKSVNISYDPHDAEAVKAAEVWRKALFAVKDEDSVKFGEQQCRDYLKGAVERYLQNKQKHVDQAVAAMKPWTPDNRKTELEKASEPLRAYLKKHGDPHTSVIVTQYGVTEMQDERHVTFDSEGAAETVKSDKPAVPEIIANPGNYGVIGFWWEDWADGRCFLRWRTEPGMDAMKVVCLTGNPDCGFQVTYPCDGAEDVAVPDKNFPWEPQFFKADSKAAAMRKVERDIESRINADDMRRLTWIRVKEPPKADLQALDRAIRDLSGVVKDDQSGLHTYFDGVNMTYVLECLKQYRATIEGGAT